MTVEIPSLPGAVLGLREKYARPSLQDFPRRLMLMIPFFCCKVGENWILLGYYTVINVNFFMVFQDNLSVPCSGPQKSRIQILEP
jgi:hypothetical protein